MISQLHHRKLLHFLRINKYTRGTDLNHIIMRHSDYIRAGGPGGGLKNLMLGGFTLDQVEIG